jgi:hypothetical protein
MKKMIRKIITALFAILLMLSACASFVVANDKKLYSLSVPASNGSVEVKVNGEVKHNGGDSCFISVPAGADVTVTAAATENSGEFMFWTDGNRNTLSEASAYSFKMLSAKEVRAWFGTSEGTRLLYRNDNATKQVLGGATFAKPEHFNNHLASSSSKLGYVFKGWSLSVEEIKSKMAAGEKLVVVDPIYESAELLVDITVSGGTIVGKNVDEIKVPLLEKITIRANDAPVGKKFVGWQTSDGVYVTENATFDVIVAKDEVFTAIFVDTSSPDNVAAGVSLTITNEADGTLRLWSSHFVPKTCSVVSYGFIYIKDGSVSEENMTLERAEEMNLSVAEYARADRNGLLTCTSNSESICARAFMVYLDEAGNTQMIYSSAMTK